MNPTIQDDPRLSAWLTDEMTAGERAEFEQQLNADPDGRAFAEEMRSLAGEVESALASEPEYRLTGSQREALFDPPAQAAAAPVPVEFPAENEAAGNILPWKRLRHTGDVTNKIRMNDRMESRRKSADFPAFAVSGAAAVILGLLVIGTVTVLRDDTDKALAKKAGETEEEVVISITSGGNSSRPARAIVGSTATGLVFRDPAQEEFRRSSFDLNPGTASYQILSNAVRDGFLPNTAGLQIEQMVNYFLYDYPEPEEEQSMSVSVESGPCPWEPEHQLVQIGLKGREDGGENTAKKSVATDIDVQVEFDPARVKEYRLIGYEAAMSGTAEIAAAKGTGRNRDFAAGDVTTALYEVVPKEESSAAADAAGDKLLTVHLNYKEPDTEDEKKGRARMLAASLELNGHKRWSDATSDFRFAASVAGFGMMLRDHGKEEPSVLDFDALQSMAEGAISGKDKLRRARFIELIGKTRKLLEKES